MNSAGAEHEETQMQRYTEPGRPPPASLSPPARSPGSTAPVGSRSRRGDPPVQPARGRKTGGRKARLVWHGVLSGTALMCWMYAEADPKVSVSVTVAVVGGGVVLGWTAWSARSRTKASAARSRAGTPERPVVPVPRTPEGETPEPEGDTPGPEGETVPTVVPGAAPRDGDGVGGEAPAPNGGPHESRSSFVGDVGEPAGRGRA